MELRGKTVILTGASSGIGLALARLLAKENVNLALVARRADILARLAEELKDSGSAVFPFKCDVSKREEIQNACREVQSRFGPVDIAILNAGVAYRGGVDPFNVEAAREIFAVNVFGVIDFIGEFLPDFKRRGEGLIVGVSSLADTRPLPRNGFYSGSKSALTYILNALRLEMKKHGVKVITVRPGFVKSAMTEKNTYPMPFMVTAEKAAAIILKGIKKGKTHIAFPFPMAAGARFVKFIPNVLYEPIASRIKK